MAARRRHWRWVASGAIILAALVAAGCGPRMMETALLLEDIAAAGGPSTLRTGRPAPRRDVLTWPDPDPTASAPAWGDLYLPADQIRGRLVLAPGLARRAKDEPLLVAFAESLALARFAVLVPEMPELRRLQVTPDHARDLAAAVVALAEAEIPGTRTGQAGLAAISYAAGPALLAATRPEAADRVAFFLAVGGYFDMTAIVRYVTTGHFRAGPDAPWQQGTPAPYARWVFVLANLGSVADSHDRALLEEVAWQALDTPDAPPAFGPDAFGPEGAAILRLVTNRDPNRVADLIAALPVGLQAQMTALSPAGQDLAGLLAPVYAVHGRDDPIVPPTESAKLIDALPAGQGRLAVLDSLHHAEFTGLPGLADQWRMVRTILALLDHRDAMLD